MDIAWIGTTRTESLSDEYAVIRHALADASKNYNWTRVLELIATDKELANTSRPSGTSLFAALHQAANGGAPLTVVRQLIDLGAWRTLQNARGERPIDVAVRNRQSHLFDALEPVFKHLVPPGVLLKIQSYFHQVIRGRVENLVQEHALRLPDLEPLLELDEPQMWFEVPGMYGGFNYWLDSTGVSATLVTESWCRMEGGSGQRHVITTEGIVLDEEGFV